MAKPQFDRRQEVRKQQQQQPQQCIETPWVPAGQLRRTVQESPRIAWQLQAKAQAKKQSSKL
jgi:hypothetical protein